MLGPVFLVVAVLDIVHADDSAVTPGKQSELVVKGDTEIVVTALGEELEAPGFGLIAPDTLALEGDAVAVRLMVAVQVEPWQP
jgi:hypothetical protein